MYIAIRSIETLLSAWLLAICNVGRKVDLFEKCVDCRGCARCLLSLLLVVNYWPVSVALGS